MPGKTVTYKFVDDKDYEDFVKVVVRQEVEHMEEASIESETEDAITVVFQSLSLGEEDEV